MHARALKCAYCLHKVSDSYVHCMECDSVNLCVTCFSTGAESGVHKKCHSYSIETLNHSKIVGLFDSDDPWTFDDELKLTEAVETYGYGNWSEVALQVRGRTAVECKHHYERFYVNGSLGSNTVLPKAVHVSRTVDHTQVDNSEPQHDRWLDHRSDICVQLGYMPYRDEFEYEYCNNAEQIITRVPFGVTDHQLEFELQLALVAMYNQQLVKRQLCHAVARTHGLLTSLSEQSTLTPKQRRSQHLALARKSNVNNQAANGHCDNSFISRNLKPALNGAIVSRLDSNQSNHNSHAASPGACTATLGSRNQLDLMWNNNTASNIDSSSTNPIHNSSITNSLCTDVPTSCSQHCTAHPWRCVANNVTSMHGPLRSRATSIHLDGTEANGLLSSYTRCTDQGPAAASTSTSDSGICSGDSCAQSTVSNSSSTTGDSTTCTGFAKTSTACPIHGRRPRSNSDSIYAATISQPTILVDKLVRQHQPDGVFPRPVINGETNGPPKENEIRSSNCTLLPPDEHPVMKRRRGRPPRNSRCTPPQSSKSPCFRNNNEAPGLSKQPQMFPQWMNPFLRYLTRDEAQKLNGNLQRESELRAECELLTNYHRQGFRCMRDIPTLPVIELTQVDRVQCVRRSRKSRAKRFTKIRPQNLTARRGRLRIGQHRLMGRVPRNPIIFARRPSGSPKRTKSKVPHGRGSITTRAHR